MDHLFADLFSLALLFFLLAAAAIFLFALVIEPAFIMVFHRPMFVHLYFLPKKLTAEQQKILLQSVPFYKRLSPRRRKYFEYRVAEFISTYDFHGKSGIAITDEIKVMVASAYVMLTFGMRNYITDTFRTIIIYPETYESTVTGQFHNGEFNPQHKAVVFSWKHFKEGFDEGNDNLNLGIHEFAHVLHFHGMKSRGATAAIFTDMYAKIMRDINEPANAKRLIESNYFRIYAYTNQYEFLAVILEHFFETPREFKREFPELFRNVKEMISFRESFLK